MSEHTPGPWGWIPEDNDDRPGVLQGSCDIPGNRHEGLGHTPEECGKLILACEYETGCEPGDFRPSAANARLIAASPTLYKFVQAEAGVGNKKAQATLDALGLTY